MTMRVHPIHPSKGARNRTLRAEAEDTKRWTCLSCTTVVETDGYCWQCASYWRDMRNGLWDHYDG